MKQRANFPKNSYHSYCRHNDQLKSMNQTHRVRRIQTNQLSHKTNLLEEFDDFESYLQFLQVSQRQTPLQQPNQQKPQESRNVATARMANRNRLRSNRHVGGGQAVAQKREGSGQPYFPFYKCRIQSSRSPSVDSQQSSFRINSRRFKLNYRIIEQNMGKADSSQTDHSLVP